MSQHKILPDDEPNETIEANARKRDRLRLEITELKGQLDECEAVLVGELKKLPTRAYVRDTFRVYIERKEKLHVEVDDETGETE